MKLVKQSDAVEYKNAPTCVAYEYETSTPDINIARIEISGRYPESGTAVNTKVTELVYVAAGTGIVCCDGVSTDLAEGDVLSIAPSERIFWEGQMTLIIACAPAWTLDQYQRNPE